MHSLKPITLPSINNPSFSAFKKRKNKYQAQLLNQKFQEGLKTAQNCVRWCLVLTSAVIRGCARWAPTSSVSSFACRRRRLQRKFIGIKNSFPHTRNKSPKTSFISSKSHRQPSTSSFLVKSSSASSKSGQKQARDSTRPGSYCDCADRRQWLCVRLR
jgi:hypothetical protein